MARPRKRNACYYCGKTFSKISEHLLGQHPEKKRVRKINTLEDRKQRRHAFNELVGKGNAKYNSLQTSKSELIMKYRKNDNVAKLIECHHCGHTYRRSSIRRHTCANKIKGERIISTSNAKQKLANKDISKELKKLLTTLREDDISNIILTDDIILHFGEKLIAGIVTDETLPFDNNLIHSESDVRATLRNLGRYVLSYRTISDNPALSLLESFEKKYHKYLPQVVKHYSQNYKHTTTPDKLRTILGGLFKASLIKLSATQEQYAKYVMLFNLFKAEWSFGVKKQVKRAKSQCTIKKRINLPTKQDLDNVKCFIEKQFLRQMKRKINAYTEYRYLLILTMTYITFFNYRRANEVPKMTVEQFHNRENGTKEYKKHATTKLDKTLCQYIEVVTLKGKTARNQIVYAYLKPDMVQGIEKILKLKKDFGLENNPYVFSIKGQKNSHAAGSKGIRDIVEKAGGSYGRITATYCRKYVATYMRWATSNVETRQLLANQLGHLLNTHENVYIENMRSITGKFFKIPAILLNLDNRNHTKAYSEVTDDDVIEYVRKDIENDDATVTEASSSEKHSNHVNNERDSEEEMNCADSEEMSEKEETSDEDETIYYKKRTSKRLKRR